MLNYGLVSTAIAEDKTRLLQGMRLLAEIAHKHGIPITWATDTKSAPAIAKSLTEWHTENGDALLLTLDIKPMWDSNWEAQREANPGNSTEAMASHVVTMREKLPEYISKEWERIKRALPWAEPSVAGAVFKNDVLLRALEQTGFQGLWGYHWNLQPTDDIEFDAPEPETDRGGFGCFYPLEASVSADPVITRDTTDETVAPQFKNIVGIPYHTAAHLAENTNNLRAALLNETAHRHYDIYVENTVWNHWLGYVEHINPLTVAQLGEEGLERLDAYFAHVVSVQDTKPIRLSQMVDDYMSHCEKTEPTTIVATSTEIQDEDANPKSVLKMFYCDPACEFTFVEGAMEPLEIKSYTSERVLQSDASKPVLIAFSPTRYRTELRINITVESIKAMPYGITVWGDHEGLQLTESNSDDVRWIGKHSLFIRLTLQPGKNEFNLKLTI
ncbi:hypothetical protein J5I95_01845 [Candidatus Poribacteria bacterium]|nr:hypothetical protein [Candidatus Poribacteria bacterium]